MLIYSKLRSKSCDYLYELRHFLKDESTNEPCKSEKMFHYRLLYECNVDSEKYRTVFFPDQLSAKIIPQYIHTENIQRWYSSKNGCYLNLLQQFISIEGLSQGPCSLTRLYCVPASSHRFSLFVYHLAPTSTSPSKKNFTGLVPYDIFPLFRCSPKPLGDPLY